GRGRGGHAQAARRRREPSSRRRTVHDAGRPLQIASVLPASLVARLRAVVGADGIVDRPEALLVYECDGYTLERAAPEVVVLPRTPAEVGAVLRVLAADKVAFVPRGAGTGLSGGTLPVAAPVVIC